MTLADVGAPIVLAGGDEFRPECESMDRTLLELRPASRRTVAILPTAAAGQRPEIAASNGVRYFESIGASAEAIIAIDHASANDEDTLRPLKSAGLIYFAGGSPTHLLQTLRSTRLWETARSAWSGGSVLAGSSAGAMVLGAWMLAPGDPTSWVETMNAVPGVAVLPHFERWGTDRRAHAISTKPPGIILLGIPGAGGVVFEPAVGQARIIGELAVTLVNETGTESIAKPGDRFTIP